MCGRFVQSFDPLVVQHELSLTSVPDIPPRFNVAPTQRVPIVTNERPHDMSILQWGLIPSWAKDTAMSGKLINARAETLDEKPSFRNAFKSRRCIVPVSGFYEWQADAEGKQPLYIHPTDAPFFTLAGLWETWKNPATGEIIPTFTIITTAANDFMRQFHERMPVILSRDDRHAWLTADDPHLRKALLQPYDPARMIAYPVSKMVNKPANDTPECIVPLAS